MTPTATVYLSLLLLLFFRPSHADDPQTAYEILQGYNFPVGLLPKGIVKYDLDPSTGRFHAYLNGSCAFSLEGSYQLKYQSTISGYISDNKLTGLSGISVKVFFLWLNIVEVDRSGDDLWFSVGIASASFSIDNFYESPQCGCGFDCVTAQGRWNDIEIGFDHIIMHLKVPLLMLDILIALLLRNRDDYIE